MAWTDSRIFSQTIIDMMLNTAALDFHAAAKVALYTNSITPDQDCTAANSAFNAGQWATAQEVTDAQGWPSGGNTLGSPAVTLATPPNVIKWDADDTASADNHSTIAACYGVLIYQDPLTTPVADQGLCFCAFSGAASVTAGTFTVSWPAAGIATITA